MLDFPSQHELSNPAAIDGHSRFARMAKRLMDIVCAVWFLVVLSPVFLVVTCLVWLDGSSPLFVQKRVGKDGRLFDFYKFRTMHDDAEEKLRHHLEKCSQSAAEWSVYQKLRHDVRVTAIGRFLRRYSLDELPQLFNVVKGDMSLVGPRPILPGQEAYYGARFGSYISVKPGITGPWQIRGRSKLTFAECVDIECHYVQNWNFFEDVLIIFKTLPALFKRGEAF